ncbi:MAG: MaoC family dehydratase [Mycobacterium sp.]
MTTGSTRRTPFVGQTAQLSRTVRANDIALFTEISGDRNPLHYDEAAAEASRFGEIVVQGGITSAILNAVVAEELPGPGTVFLNVNWAFKAPVRPGDTITGRVEVISSRTDKPITELKTTVTRDDGTVVLNGTAVCYTMDMTTGNEQ